MAYQKTTPTVSGDDKIVILPGTTTNTMPTDFSQAVYMQECVNTMPQMFPEKESQEYKVLASKQARNIPGSRGAIEDPINVYYTVDLLTAHAKMVSFQNQAAGCFWIMWYINAQDRTVACRMSVDDHISTPTEESGGLDTLELKISNVGETIEATGDLIGDPVLRQVSVTSIAGTTGNTIINTDPSFVAGLSTLYKTGASVTLPAYDDVITTSGAGSYTPFASGMEYSATDGNDFAVVFVEPLTLKVKYAGKTSAVVG